MRKIGNRAFLFIVAAVIVVYAALQSEEQSPVVVTKVIDGDTVIIQGGESVRLLGIDSDERGHPCYAPAKKRLEELVLGKTVYLEKDNEDKDQYGRLLRHVFLGEESVNAVLVAEGLAIARFEKGNEKYKEGIIAAERYAMENKIGCKWSG